MPITSIRLKNFKCFADSGEIPLRPLTVIFGRNNTGKSSILHGLSIFCQSLDSMQGARGSLARLNLDGSLHMAGSYSDCVHKHDMKKRIRVIFGIQYLAPSRPWSGRRFAPRVASFHRVMSNNIRGYIHFEFGQDEPQPPLLMESLVEIPEGKLAPVHWSLRKREGRYIPMLRVGKSDVSISDYVLNDSGPYFGNANPYLSNVSRYWEEKPNRLPLGIAEKVFDELRDHFQRMRAIGAFRQSPLRRYEFQGSSNLPDPAGANVIAAIIADSLREGRAERNRLLKAINQWMDRVGQVRLMPVRRISKIARLYELRLRDTDSGRWANFADVGFGIAQALPVIVEGLRTPEGAMFLVQEPEIHLHPDAQLAMADYLVGLVKARRGVIVETHSEHMVLRFRNLLLSNARNGRSAPKLKPEEVSFVYVDKDKTGKSHARALELDNLAQFKDWPKDFMEEASRERLDILEKMARRMNK